MNERNCKPLFSGVLGFQGKIVRIFKLFGQNGRRQFIRIELLLRLFQTQSLLYYDRFIFSYAIGAFMKSKCFNKRKELSLSQFFGKSYANQYMSSIHKHESDTFPHYAVSICHRAMSLIKFHRIFYVLPITRKRLGLMI